MKPLDTAKAYLEAVAAGFRHCQNPAEVPSRFREIARNLHEIAKEIERYADKIEAQLTIPDDENDY